MKQYCWSMLHYVVKLNTEYRTVCRRLIPKHCKLDSHADLRLTFFSRLHAVYWFAYEWGTKAMEAIGPRGSCCPLLDPLVCGPYLSGRAFQFAIRIDLTRYANRFESIRLVKKIGFSIL